jgi:hypothetical protein
MRGSIITLGTKDIVQGFPRGLDLQIIVIQGFFHVFNLFRRDLAVKGMDEMPEVVKRQADILLGVLLSGLVGLFKIVIPLQISIFLCLLAAVSVKVGEDSERKSEEE